MVIAHSIYIKWQNMPQSTKTVWFMWAEEPLKSRRNNGSTWSNYLDTHAPSHRACNCDIHGCKYEINIINIVLDSSLVSTAATFSDLDSSNSEKVASVEAREESIDDTGWSKATVTSNFSLASLKITKNGITQPFLCSLYAAVLVFWCLILVSCQKTVPFRAVPK